MKKEEIKALANKYGFDLEAGEWRVNESGLDFLVVLFKDAAHISWVLRIPRRTDVQKEIEKEQKILRLVQPNLSVQAPKWEVASNDLIVYQVLDGLPAGTINKEEQRYDWVIDPENLPAIYIESLAKGMVSLHSIPFEKIRDHGLSAPTIDQIKETLQNRMDKVNREMGVSEKLWARWQKWMNEESMWPKHTGFIHGDLHPGHILIGANEEVTGFIDWTEGKVADVSTDFIGHLRTHGERELSRLIQAYEQAGGIVWPKMNEHVMELAATYPIDIAEFAIKSESEEYMEMARAALNEA